jgi:hypothetical protein
VTALDKALAIEVRCPKCGNDGRRGSIRYLVDMVCRADVVRLGDGAVLELAGPLRESVRDPHMRPRFECVCGHRWPVPDGISRVTWEARS